MLRHTFNSVSFAILFIFIQCFSPSSLAESKTAANSIDMEMVRIPAGTFQMGSDLPRDYWDEWPAHEVTISEPFYISQTEVTVEQYKQFDPDWDIEGKFGDYVCGVSWYDAAEFCEWLSEKEGKPYRLPTEAEWEYACRAGTTTLYASGDDEPEHEWSNAWGVKNMHTGAREWCYDWYGDYPRDPQIDPVGPESGMARVIRGGCPDNDSRYEEREMFNTSSSRASIAPAFGVIEGSSKDEQDIDLQEGYKTGLIGTWYGESDLTNPKGESILSRPDNNWINDKNKGRNWSACWRGYIEAPYTGEVTFAMRVANGGKLIIDGEEIIDEWDEKGDYRAKMDMVEGEKYPIELSYNRDRSRTYLRLSWSWPGEDLHVIPEDAFSYGQEEAAMVEGPEEEIPGSHWIGFRVVQAPMPDTKPMPVKEPYVREGIRKNEGIAKIGPDPSEPYFRKRYLLPVPFDNSSNEEIDSAGMHPSFRGHNHSPAMEVCPNGDVLLITYTSYDEYEPGVTLAASRLRFGADKWDMPDPMFDFAAVNDHAPMLWTDSDTMYFFWGGPNLEGAFPFQWRTSKDSGANWSEVHFPHFKGEIGAHSKQPINTALRDKYGTMYVASDGSGGRSVLWASSDKGKTWYDTGGRSAGRHTTYALLSDGETILGMGGKNTDIDGYMPKAVSSDGGKTWEVSKTPFAAQGTNQRPSVLRLESGRLFFAGDYQHFDGHKPDGIKEDGSYVALSEDDGESWIIKPLVGDQQHERSNKHGGHETLGYSVARQAPNGMIHLIATMTEPCLHFELNEAWILSDENENQSYSEEQIMSSSAETIEDVKKYKETYPDGTLKLEYSGGIADDGRFLLHGKEIWYYPSGSKKREARYELGKKIGQETYWSEDGQVCWRWDHQADGTSYWTQYWPNGQMKARSEWRDFKCDGIAERWSSDGELISRVEFENGEIDD
ncbi:Serine/threonine-protein kinase pkn1 [Sedimentisphaera salicampi]|nr:Serine/threonine-protein kinase pkn1 [Sedimentisphaera salicampi]